MIFCRGLPLPRAAFWRFWAMQDLTISTWSGYASYLSCGPFAGKAPPARSLSDAGRGHYSARRRLLLDHLHVPAIRRSAMAARAFGTAAYCRRKRHRVRGMGGDHTVYYPRHRLERHLGFTRCMDRAEKFWPEIFPNYLGASQYRLTLLTQIADVTGILGVTFLVVYVNSLIFAIIERRLEKKPFPFRPVAVFAAVIALVLAYGTVRVYTVDKNVSAAQKLTVGLVQTNRGGEEKYKDRDRFLREHMEMSKELIASNKIDLIVWPENTLTTDLTSREGRLPPDVLDNQGTPTLFGAILRIESDDETRLYNSAVLVNGTGQITGTYDKMTLVPFGEYIPFGETFPWLYSWSPYSVPVLAWRELRNRSSSAFIRSRYSICYEEIFPGQIRRLMNGGKDGRISRGNVQPDQRFMVRQYSGAHGTPDAREFPGDRAPASPRAGHVHRYFRDHRPGGQDNPSQRAVDKRNAYPPDSHDAWPHGICHIGRLGGLGCAQSLPFLVSAGHIS